METTSIPAESTLAESALAETPGTVVPTGVSPVLLCPASPGDIHETNVSIKAAVNRMDTIIVDRCCIINLLVH